MNKEEHGVKFLKERGHRCALSELNKGCRIDSWPTPSEKCIKKNYMFVRAKNITMKYGEK